MPVENGTKVENKSEPLVNKQDAPRVNDKAEGKTEADKQAEKPITQRQANKPKAVEARKPVAPPVPEDRADPMPETPEQAQALAELNEDEGQADESQELKVKILFRQLENRQLECIYVTDGDEAEEYAREFGGIVVNAVQFIPDRGEVTDEDRELPTDRAMRLAKKMEREANQTLREERS